MFNIKTALLLSASLVVSWAQAAEVGSGTLSLGQLELEFSGGPIVGTNATNAGGDDLQCEDPVLPCDTFALSVDLPPDLGNFFPSALLRVNVDSTSSPSGADDYDLNLYDGNGNLLGSSTSPGASEAVSALAFGGVRDYTVEVVHWLVLGGNYAAKMRLSLGQPSAQKTDEEIEQWLTDNGGSADTLAMARSDAFARAAEACVAPGITILTDPAGDVSPLGLLPGVPLDNLDLTELSVFQVGSPNDPENPPLIGFRLKAVDLSLGLIPNTGYFTSFTPSNGGPVFGVRMQVDSEGAESFFSYVGGANNAGDVDGRFVEAGTERPAHPSSFFDDSGEIVIFVQPQAIGLLQPGDKIVNFNAASTLGVSLVVGGVTDTPDTMPNGLGRQGVFTYLSDAECAADADSRSAVPSRNQSTGVQGGGALGGVSLLMVLLLARRRG